MEERQGSSRHVILHGQFAVKFARNPEGKRANLHELRVWKRYREDPEKGPLLCPVLWCASDGSVLIMPRAEPVDASTWSMKKIPKWDYDPNGGIGWPFEPKAADWGILDGHIVAVDYGNRDDE
jgi:hypothetical protein